jgi:hypothetical protein
MEPMRGPLEQTVPAAIESKKRAAVNWTTALTGMTSIATLVPYRPC